MRFCVVMQIRERCWDFLVFSNGLEVTFLVALNFNHAELQKSRGHCKIFQYAFDQTSFKSLSLGMNVLFSFQATALLILTLIGSLFE